MMMIIVTVPDKRYVALKKYGRVDPSGNIKREDTQLI